MNIEIIDYKKSCIMYSIYTNVYKRDDLPGQTANAPAMRGLVS